MKFLNFGSLNIDTQMKVDKIVRPGETISGSLVEKSPGGKGLNQAIALSRLSDRVFHAGSIGPDGGILRDFLENEGVDTSFLRKSQVLTGNALIQVDKRGENAIVLYKGANFDNEKSYMDEVLKNFEKGDVLVLQNEINNLSYLIERAYEIGMKIVLNPSPITDALKDLDLAKVDLVLVNEHEGAYFAKTKDTEAIIAYFKEKGYKAVLTLGKRGSVAIVDGKEFFQRAYEVKAIDTTGAGDTFAGFFISSYYKTGSIEESLDLAARASALSVRKKGAARSIPTLDEVKNYTDF